MKINYAYSIYSFNKQVNPNTLLNDVTFGIVGYPAPSVAPEFINYNLETFDIDIYYSSPLSIGDQNKLTDIVNAYVYDDMSLNATYNEITSNYIINNSGATFYGNNVFQIISATTYQNLPTDVFVTGGTYSNGTITFNNSTGGTFAITGFVTGDTFVTGLTYNTSNKNITISQNRNDSYSALTVNIPDIFVTSGVYSNGTATFTNNTGGTFAITGFYTGNTDLYITGGSFSNNILTLNRQDGNVSISGFTDYYVTGGTFDVNTGILTLNRQDGSFNINGFVNAASISGDTYVTGLSYSSNTLTVIQNRTDAYSALTVTIPDTFVTGGTYLNGTITFTNNTGGTFSVTGITTGGTGNDTYVTGLTYNTNTKNITISQNRDDSYSALTVNVPDIFVTSGVYSNGTATFTNNTGGTFAVTGFVTGDTFVTGMTFSESNRTLTLSQNNNRPDLTATILDSYVTGFTYNNNIFTLSRNNSLPDLTATINTVTGLTINGALLVNDGLTVTGLTSIAQLRVTTSPVNGYILTSDASGNATWQPSPALSGGSTKLDMQTVTRTSTVTSTANSSTWVDIGAMTIAAKNLTSSATTYIISFSCTASLSTNAGVGNFQILLNGNTIVGSSRQITNGGAAMAGTARSVASNAFITNVKSGDIIKVQFNSPTGQVTVTNRALTVLGILTINLA